MGPVQSRNRLTVLLQSLAVREGIHPSGLDGVAFMRASEPNPRSPVLYEPSIFILGQGRKRIYLGDQVYIYDRSNYLVLSVPLPVECETEASPQEPLLGVKVGVNLAVLGELITTMNGGGIPPAPTVPPGIYSTALDERLQDATVRLLECLSKPAEVHILGPQIVREITYLVLCGEQGVCLRALAAMHSRLSQLSRALQRIHSDYGRPWDVQTLADIAGMSQSAFHQNFKAVTSASPLQYLKTVRLHKARLLMAHEGLRASMAAERVGYESSSQFSREFKRLFGASPVEEASRMRERLGLHV